MVLSPAKKLGMDCTFEGVTATMPDHLEDSETLVQQLREMDGYALATLMKLSLPLADLNHQRYQSWHRPFTQDNASHALAVFRGDVYQTLQADDFTTIEQVFTQQHLRILSGLYGLLRPHDLMQAYRLEMGTSLATQRGRNLYQFWGRKITDSLNKQMQVLNTGCLLNLASQEYFKVIQPELIVGRVVTPVFKEYHRGVYKVIGIHAKRARGLMARFIIQHKLTHVEEIKAFDAANYRWNAEASTPELCVFHRCC